MKAQIPEIAVVTKRIQEVIHEPKRITVKMPKDIKPDVESIKSRLYGYKPYVRGVQTEVNDEYTLPPLWNLRPNKKDTTESLLEEIAKLPTKTAPSRWGEMRLPWPVKQVSITAFRSAFLPSDRPEEDIVSRGRIYGISAKKSFVFMGKRITPTGDGKYHIETVDKLLSFTLEHNPSHPSHRWTLYGTVVSANGVKKPHHPEDVHSNRNKPNWTRPTDMCVFIHQSSVYGDLNTAGSLKWLSFWDVLDVSVQYVWLMEYAYKIRETYSPEYPADAYFTEKGIVEKPKVSPPTERYVNYMARRQKSAHGKKRWQEIRRATEI